ncbi:MAG: ribonuclease HII [Rhizobiaceae bacterium]
MTSGPDFSTEIALRDRGFQHICGTDEAGRGPLAGPVIAVAVILDPDNIPAGLDDSKKLTETKRTSLFDVILQNATTSIASVSAATIDATNIRAASLQAMRLAVIALEIEADYVLIDGNALPNVLPCPGETLIKGDSRSLSIAAASIVAKVTRDRMMAAHHVTWPEYGFAEHKGYPTAAHRKAVAEFGPCPIHRRSFAPVREALAKNNPPPVSRGGF